jgi:hypothetical protein
MEIPSEGGANLNGVGRIVTEFGIKEGQMYKDGLKGFGRIIEKDKYHIGWFKNDSTPHGFGIGNMFTGENGGEQEGWYEVDNNNKGSLDYFKSGWTQVRHIPKSIKKDDFEKPLVEGEVYGSPAVPASFW